MISKNKKLILQKDNECLTIDGLEHAHGGYKCGSDNKWNTSKCEPYYCDIGYSLDQYKKECVPDCQSDYNVEFLFEKNYYNSIEVSKDNTYLFYNYNFNNNAYVFISSENNIENYPRICFIQSEPSITIKSNGKESKLKIESINSDFIFNNFKMNSIITEKMIPIHDKQLYTIQMSEETMINFQNVLGLNNAILKYAKYKDGMNYRDILEVKDSIFKDVPGKALKLDQNEIYFMYINSISTLQSYMLISMNPSEKYQFSKNDLLINYIYLQKDKEYSFELKDISPKMIKLSKDTPKSEISIKESDKKINEKNSYYFFNETGENLFLYVEKEDAILELLSIYKGYSLIELNGETTGTASNGIIFLKVPKTIKEVEIKFEAKDLATYFIYSDYSVLLYFHNLSVDNNELLTAKSYSLNIKNIYKEELNLADDEFYYICVDVKSGILSMTYSKNNDSQSGEENEDNFPTWGIILIIVFGLLIIIVVSIIVFLKIKKKKDVSEEDIGNNMDNMNLVEGN
jgi:hypothetical protein